MYDVGVFLVGRYSDLYKVYMFVCYLSIYIVYVYIICKDEIIYGTCMYVVYAVHTYVLCEHA